MINHIAYLNSFKDKNNIPKSNSFDKFIFKYEKDTLLENIDQCIENNIFFITDSFLEFRSLFFKMGIIYKIFKKHGFEAEVDINKTKFKVNSFTDYYNIFENCDDGYIKINIGNKRFNITYIDYGNADGFIDILADFFKFSDNTNLIGVSFLYSLNFSRESFFPIIDILEKIKIEGNKKVEEELYLPNKSFINFESKEDDFDEIILDDDKSTEEILDDSNEDIPFNNLDEDDYFTDDFLKEPLEKPKKSPLIKPGFLEPLLKKEKPKLPPPPPPPLKMKLPPLPKLDKKNIPKIKDIKISNLDSPLISNKDTIDSLRKKELKIIDEMFKIIKTLEKSDDNFNINISNLLQGFDQYTTKMLISINTKLHKKVINNFHKLKLNKNNNKEITKKIIKETMETINQCLFELALLDN